MANTIRVPKEKDVSEAERLDRIGRRIQQLADASTGVQRELTIARERAAARRQSVQPHISAKPSRRRTSR